MYIFQAEGRIFIWDIYMCDWEVSELVIESRCIVCVTAWVCPTLDHYGKISYCNSQNLNITVADQDL